MTRLCFCILIMVSLSGRQIQAQNKVCVIDKISNSPLIGASVVSDEKTVITNEDGCFDINKLSLLELSDTITIAFVGYLTKKITQEEIIKNIIYMSRSAVQMSEVAVIGKHICNKNINLEELASLKHGVFAFGAAFVGDSIYVIGGDASIKNEYEDRFHYEGNNGKIQIYDVKNNKWSVSKTKVSDRAYHNIHYYDGKIYILGGKWLAPNPKLEYLNNKVEVYDIKKDTVYSSKSNPHEAVNFASGLYGSNLIVMNGSIKQYRKKKTYTNEVHLMDLKTGFWYKLNNLPHSYETTAVIGDSILYQVGGFKNQALGYVNAYNVLTEEYRTQTILPIALKRPALAYNAQQKVIYMYEGNKLITYNILTEDIFLYKIDLALLYSAMLYKDDYLYIIGGKECQNITSEPSEKLYRINIQEIRKARASRYIIHTKNE